MFLAKMPAFITKLNQDLLWRIPTRRKVIYLTFDDGPIPDVTPWVLDTLDQYDAKATFFCVGENAIRHNDILARIKAHGHSVGHHTFNHLNGSRTKLRTYLRNVTRGAEVVGSNLFRPPYGRISLRQRWALMRKYRIVMWDVLSGDYDKRLSPEQCLKNVTRNARPGSIVVLHDSIKAESRLRKILPQILDYFKQRGYVFESITKQ